jgi:hypothetical protein
MDAKQKVFVREQKLILRLQAFFHLDQRRPRTFGTFAGNFLGRVHLLPLTLIPFPKETRKKTGGITPAVRVAITARGCLLPLGGEGQDEGAGGVIL